MANYFDMIITPIEKFLDDAIDSGNIWYYLIGIIAIVGFLVIKKMVS